MDLSQTGRNKTKEDLNVTLFQEEKDLKIEEKRIRMKTEDIKENTIMIPDRVKNVGHLHRR